MLSRRSFTAAAVAALATRLPSLPPAVAGPVAPVTRPAGPFAQRGYYLTFCRMPTYGLPAWRRIVDAVAADGGNTLLLWVAGAIRTDQFPVTWRYNADHANVRDDFLNPLIAHAHTLGVRVLLGLTPFGYDGVNQFPLERPDLRATGPDGKPAARFGIGCWGYNLCPSRPDSQRFMLGYARELLARYPDADGLLLESSDYAACHCPDCRGHYYEREFAFVRQISDDVWARRPGATVVVYPHYFSGAAAVPALGVAAAKLPFDPRWALLFTPHSARPEPDLIRRARASLWSDDAPARRGPAAVRAGARRAAAEQMTGYVPSMEAFTFVAAEAEEGQGWLVGRRQVPLGFGWLAAEDPPYGELPQLPNRVAYREFARDPDLPEDRYRQTLGREAFGPAATPGAIDDLLAVQAAFAGGRTWCQPALATSPDRARAMAARGELTPAARAACRAALDGLRAVAGRRGGGASAGERELARVARWAADQWTTEDLRLLDPDR